MTAFQECFHIFQHWHVPLLSNSQEVRTTGLYVALQPVGYSIVYPYYRFQLGYNTKVCSVQYSTGTVCTVGEHFLMQHEKSWHACKNIQYIPGSYSRRPFACTQRNIINSLYQNIPDSLVKKKRKIPPKRSWKNAKTGLQGVVSCVLSRGS